MRHEFAVVNNVVRLQTAFGALVGRDLGIPGMGLVYGQTGYGKTTTIAWLRNQVNAVYVRAAATWTPSSMLGRIMEELGAEPLGRSAAMVAHIVEQLARSGRALFVDEGDYLLGNLMMLETLRDIHDLSSMPVVLIGMKGIEKRIIHRQQFSRRVSHWVEFLPSTIQDARILTDAVCEVCIEDDLLAHLHEEAKGNIGLMTVGLSRIEAFAKAQKKHSLSLNQWGNRQLFLPVPKGGGN